MYVYIYICQTFVRIKPKGVISSANTQKLIVKICLWKQFKPSSHALSPTICL